MLGWSQKLLHFEGADVRGSISRLAALVFAHAPANPRIDRRTAPGEGKGVCSSSIVLQGHDLRIRDAGPGRDKLVGVAVDLQRGIEPLQIATTILEFTVCEG